MELILQFSVRLQEKNVCSGIGPWFRICMYTLFIFTLMAGSLQKGQVGELTLERKYQSDAST